MSLFPHRTELSQAFQATVPVMLGYLAIGMAFGIMAEAAGIPAWITLAMSVFIYAGAAQYLAVSLFARTIPAGDIAVLTFLVNARHMVYGISLLDSFRPAGKARPYLMFGLTDETYALISTLKPDSTIDRSKLYLYITALNQLWWICGSMLGFAAGNILPLPAEDVGFALCALFAVLVVEQWKASPAKHPFVIAGLACALALLLAGSNMLLPAIGIGIATLIIHDRIRELRQS